MKKVLSVIVLLGLALLLLTGCGEKEFDGKWSCYEAQIDTHGVESAYRTLENYGAIGTFCQVEIDGDNVKYSEIGTTYTVTDVSRKGSEMVIKLKGSYGATYKATLTLVDDGNSILVKKDGDTYWLERSDIWHVILGFFRDLPVWIYIVAGVALVLVIFGKVSSAKKGNRAKQ